MAINAKVLEAARQSVAGQYSSTYHRNAILEGEWDTGYLVKNEVARLLKNPPLADEEGEEV
jgi:hypothetical protein